ncbi:MAG TPA: gamma-glutamyl-gamma-aminobutyrate hydrolase family protein [Anaerolineales bacterium]|nr:gamma-glutamyl-gamma-aminobutyrate hydrolase family protein [Anaerolineales bacterium]
MPPPLIGVTTWRTSTNSGTSWISIAEAYVQAISEAGACPVAIPVGLPAERLAALLAKLDGVLFTGGGDLNPRTYGGESLPGLKEVDDDRDRLELHLLHKVLEYGLPFLGICRGIQVVNVGLGGRLYTDIPSQYPGAIQHDFHSDWPRDYLAHEIQIRPGSRLRHILGESSLQVNSLHHQGIRQLAPGLLATARAPDELIEAVELSDHSFGLAVQWHPECLTDHKPMRNLFRAFVEHTEKKRGK